MPYAEDHITLAAEYALGTLDAEEREQAEAMMAMDGEFEAIVTAWQLRLAALNQMVGPVEPRGLVWERIQAAIAAEPGQRALEAEQPAGLVIAAPQPITEPTTAERTRTAGPAEAIPMAPATSAWQPRAGVVDFNRRVRRWRGLASAAMALAAVLFVALALQIYDPEVLPSALRPRLNTPLPVPAQYVALLQAPGGGPAFILTVDGATRNFTVRKVDAAPEPGKSYELWLISDKLPQPRSLGVIGGGDFTTRPLLANYDPKLVNSATYAVTVEPSGGSPTGQPSAPPVFSGKLIETVPAQQPSARK